MFDDLILRRKQMGVRFEVFTVIRVLSCGLLGYDTT
jgi:hypothetical protein